MLKLVKYISALMILSTTGAYGAGDLSLIGREATVDEVHAWDQDVRPDGLGLPAGSGSVTFGEEVFSEKCAACHGDFAEGAGRWPELAGGQGSLTSQDPVKTIGSYWPYLSIVWDYINEAMPFGDARSLSNDEIYAITAWLLYMNDLVDEDFVLSDQNFQEVRLPNENGFYEDDRDEVEVPIFSADACMSDCRDPDFKIVASAAAIDVTPDAVADDAPVVTPEPVEIDPELVERGKAIFRKCRACHSIEDGKNGTGPHMNGVFNRAIASVEGYKYSDALTEFGADGGVWDDENLRYFLENPMKNLKGTRMSFAGVQESDMDALIAYLSTL